MHFFLISNSWQSLTSDKFGFDFWELTAKCFTKIQIRIQDKIKLKLTPKSFNCFKVSSVAIQFWCRSEAGGKSVDGLEVVAVFFLGKALEKMMSN